MKYDTIVISGGASRSVYSLGVIAKHWKDIDSVYKYVGTSAGSLACLLLICDYSIDEILRTILNVKMEYSTKQDTCNNLSGIGQFIQPYLTMVSPWIDRVSNLISNNGILEQNPYICVAEQMVYNKFGKIPTLHELYKLTGKKLVTVGACITTYDPVYFSYEKFPDMPCTLAVDISCRVPFIFTPIKYEGHFYVDGGLSDHFPISQKEGNTLAIYTRGIELGETQQISFVRFFWSLINTSTKGRYNNLRSNDDLTLYVLRGPGGSMSVTTEEAIEMYNVGFSSNPE